MASTLLISWLAVALLMALLWFVQFSKHEADIVDVGWSLAIALVAVIAGWNTTGFWQRRLFLVGLVSFWALRLSAHLFFHRFLVPGEDARYAKLREKWGSRAQFNFFVFFQIQALLAVFLGVPFVFIAANEATAFSGWEMMAVLIWCLALFGEISADQQLQRFKDDPLNAGLACNSGLWRYSRHPNYFFEWLHWWSYALFLLATPQWWLAIVNPAVMLYLLLYVTGVPPSEARALESRAAVYREYQRTTSAFIPWFPKKGAA